MFNRITKACNQKQQTKKNGNYEYSKNSLGR